MGNSPWGKIQGVRQLERGWRWVSTASHGGYMLTRRFAEKHLSPAARKRAEEWVHYLCYEEDCAYAIVDWEIRSHWEETFAYASDTIKADKEAHLLRVLSGYYPDYLIEIGVEPEPEAFARWQDFEDYKRMKVERHPDLIVSAVGSHHLQVPKGAVMVTTADGKTHMLDAEHYAAHRKAKTSRNTFLSKCQPFDWPPDLSHLAASLA